MSLLPGTIIPALEPIGRVNDDGTVTIEKNWWLFLYNIAEQVLLNGSGVTTLVMAEIGLTKPPGTDYDRKIADLQAQLASLPNPQGRIAALERQVADLQAVLYSLKMVS
jgi:hypothetical protein